MPYITPGAVNVPSGGAGMVPISLINELVKGANNIPWVQPRIITAAGALTVDVGVNVVTAGSALALTLAAPTAGAQAPANAFPRTSYGQDCSVLVVASTTAYAHTVTATGLLQTGSASVNVATFAAQAGCSLTLMAYNGKWVVLSSNGVTFS